MPIISLVLAYLLGSIPFGLLLSKAMGEGDLRKIGSGNIGATNAMRTGNKKLAALTLLLDMFKGTIAVWIAIEFAPEYAALAGLIAVLGHIYPAWLKFKGGKGVATGLGVFLGLSPLLFLFAIAVWLGMFKWKKISSLSALTAYLLAPLASFFLLDNAMATFYVLIISMLIFYTHRSNIQRLITGEEATFKK